MLAWIRPTGLSIKCVYTYIYIYVWVHVFVCIPAAWTSTFSAFSGTVFFQMIRDAFRMSRVGPRPRTWWAFLARLQSSWFTVGSNAVSVPKTCSTARFWLSKAQVKQLPAAPNPKSLYKVVHSFGFVSALFCIHWIHWFRVCFVLGSWSFAAMGFGMWRPTKRR